MPSHHTPVVSAVVVTYNRLELLKRCLAALKSQTGKLESLLVVDNASTDGTDAFFAADCERSIRYLRLNENVGGAGGFASGLLAAIDSGADWIWMMDDDAEPNPTALQELMDVATDPGSIYGSVAVNGVSTSWAVTLLGPPIEVVHDAAQVPDCAVVQSLPFLGFLIHRDLVRRIGLPDAGYFIAADDIEYCLRARRSGAHLYIAGRSRIEHPKTATRVLRVLGRDIVYLSLAPWKRYYDTRNRILNARKYAPVKLFTNVLPGTMARLIYALFLEPNKLKQLRAFCAGTIDGLLSRKGKRHELLGI